MTHLSGNLQGQVCLITGANSGIGEAIAHTLAKAGGSLVLAARRAEKLELLKSTLTQAYPTTSIIAVPTDVTDSKACHNLIQKAMASFGRVDALINNAGVASAIGLLQEVDEASVHKMVDTNLKAPIFLMQAALPQMVTQKSGTIININSVAGRTAYPYWAVYDATKFGLHALTEAVAEEQRDNGIRVTGIYPGAVNTPIWDGMAIGETSPDRHGMLTAAQVADAVLYVLQQPQHVFISELVIKPLANVM